MLTQIPLFRIRSNLDGMHMASQPLPRFLLLLSSTCMQAATELQLQREVAMAACEQHQLNQSGSGANCVSRASVSYHRTTDT